ncbi:hypothetical protein BDN72DRAFT_859100 [Pluteus cervinus]|uniref:Uncharacterized protein n=1 Tax=Pluteus cervinus TaxID=181527 RepID=A0ACD3ANM2_9AGAR|nr:hypothetical protein BDN72DRAFT_859100 [Pluteus cervinus]
MTPHGKANAHQDVIQLVGDELVPAATALTNAEGVEGKFFSVIRSLDYVVLLNAEVGSTTEKAYDPLAREEGTGRMGYTFPKRGHKVEDRTHQSSMIPPSSSVRLDTLDGGEKVWTLNSSGTVLRNPPRDWMTLRFAYKRERGGEREEHIKSNDMYLFLRHSNYQPLPTASNNWITLVQCLSGNIQVDEGVATPLELPPSPSAPSRSKTPKDVLTFIEKVEGLLKPPHRESRRQEKKHTAWHVFRSLLSAEIPGRIQVTEGCLGRSGALRRVQYDILKEAYNWECSEAKRRLVRELE